MAKRSSNDFANMPKSLDTECPEVSEAPRPEKDRARTPLPSSRYLTRSSCSTSRTGSIKDTELRSEDASLLTDPIRTDDILRRKKKKGKSRDKNSASSTNSITALTQPRSDVTPPCLDDNECDSVKKTEQYIMALPDPNTVPVSTTDSSPPPVPPDQRHDEHVSLQDVTDGHKRRNKPHYSTSSESSTTLVVEVSPPLILSTPEPGNMPYCNGIKDMISTTSLPSSPLTTFPLPMPTEEPIMEVSKNSAPVSNDNNQDDQEDLPDPIEPCLCSDPPPHRNHVTDVFMTIVLYTDDEHPHFSKMHLQLLRAALQKILHKNFSIISTSLGCLAVTVSCMEDHHTLLNLRTCLDIKVTPYLVSAPIHPTRTSLTYLDKFPTKNVSFPSSTPSTDHPHPSGPAPIPERSELQCPPMPPQTQIISNQPVRTSMPMVSTAPCEEHAQCIDRMDVTEETTIRDIPPPQQQFPVIFQPVDQNKTFRPLQTEKIWTEILRTVPNRSHIEGLKLLRKGGLLLRATSSEVQDALLKMTSLLDMPIKASRTRGDLNCRGVIYGLHPDTSAEYIKTHIEDSALQVLEVAKINDPRGKLTLAVLTFAGSALPRTLTCDGARYQVRPYYEAPIQCTHCYRLAHTASVCRSLALCVYCSKSAHRDGICPDQSRSLSPKCINCSCGHISTAKECPARKIQVEILKYRAKHKTSFATAKEHILPRGYSFQDALKRLAAPSRFPYPPSIAQTYQAPLTTTGTSYNSSVPPIRARTATKNYSYASAVSQVPPPQTATATLLTTRLNTVDPATLNSLISLLTKLCSALIPAGPTQDSGIDRSSNSPGHFLHNA